MMKILLLTVGNLPQGPLAQTGGDFTKRLARFADLEVRAVKNDHDLLERIPTDYLRIVLDAKGKSLTSEAFAKKLEAWQNEGAKIAFVLGGPHGLTEETKKRAHLCLSLSAMTTTHDLAHLFLLEQLYRAFTIIKKMAYHY